MKNKKKQKRINGKMKFFLIVVLIYLIIGLINFPIAKNALLNFLNMFLRILPILGIVFVVMVGINLYFTQSRAKKYLGEKSGIKGWIYAIIFGILISGPPYVLYPLLGDLKKQGMKNSLIAVLLYNRNVKIPFLPALIYYFGLPFTIILSIYILIFSILNGKLIELLVDD